MPDSVEWGIGAFIHIYIFTPLSPQSYYRNSLPI